MALDIPNMQFLARPVTSFYEGRALRQRERLAAQEEELNALRIDAIKNPQADPELQMKREKAQREAEEARRQSLESFQKTGQEFAKQQIAYEDSLRQSGLEDNDINTLLQSKWSQAIQTMSDTYGEALGAQFDPDGQWNRSEAEAWLTASEGEDGGVTANMYNPSTREVQSVRRDSPEWDQLAEAGWREIGKAQPTGSLEDLGMVDSSTRRGLQEELMSVNTSIDRLQTLGATFDPKFLTIPGRIQNLATRARELDIPLLGTLIGDPTESEQKFLRDFTNFRSVALRELNALINRLSGAATSAQEAERLRSTMPDPDSNTVSEFVSNFNSTMRDLQLIKARNMLAIKDGLDVTSGDDLAGFMTLDSVKEKVNTRYRELATQYQEQGMSEDEARREAQLAVAKEFGI